MGKTRSRYKQENSSTTHNQKQNEAKTKNIRLSTASTPIYSKIISDWVYEDRYGLAWITSCILLGFILGLSIGTGHITGAYGIESIWRQTLANRIRSCYWYQISNNVFFLFKYTLHNLGPYRVISHIMDLKHAKENAVKRKVIMGATIIETSSMNEHKFYALREMIIREDGGYVHPDLGFLIPAPSGAERGIGVVGTSYEKCQRCFNESDHDDILLRIPLSIQMTRSLALSTLLPLLPSEVQRRVPLEDLDDAALLVLLLAHERSKNMESKFYPYIATLPKNPTCGYNSFYRYDRLKNIIFLGQELGMDVNGWHAELIKASDYADRIANALSRDYGVYILNNIHSTSGRHISKNKFQSMAAASSNAFAAIQWSLCQVSSRATAGSEKYGSLRLIPLLDLVNHDAEADGFHEISTSTSGDDGAFTLRSRRHGRPKRLKQGKELMANYNVPNYSPLDWFINVGFVPPERTHRWVKLDAGLPRQYTKARNDVIKNGEYDDNSNFFTTKDVPAGGTRLNVVTTNSDGESTTHHFHIANEL